MDKPTENSNVNPCDSPFSEVPIEITISVGKAFPRVKDLMEMGQDDILSLDKRIDEPVDLFVGDRLIARGELQELEGDSQGRLAVRLTEVINLQSGN